METYVYAGNLPFDVTEEMLKEKFGTAGTVLEVKIAKDPERDLFMGYSFIKMNSAEEVEKVIKQLQDHPLGERKMYLMPGSEAMDLWERAFGA